jgi:putative iron-only hydrogenase system regulator
MSCCRVSADAVFFRNGECVRIHAYICLPYGENRLFLMYQADEEKSMDTRVAVISMIIEEADAVRDVNELLHEMRDMIIGRMGIPYREKNISVITVALDAPQQKISALSGRLGQLRGVSVKTAYASLGGGKAC